MLGISRMAGNASVKPSTSGLILSAICPRHQDVSTPNQTKMALSFTYMLIDQKHADIFSLSSEVVECPFDGRSLRLGIDDEEVALRIRGIGNMLLIVLVTVTISS